MTVPARLEDLYRIEGELGRGGFGVVLGGRAVADGRQVAIKLALAETAQVVVERVEREARLLVGLDHPRLVGLVGCLPSASGSLALVYERVDGRGLDDVLRDGLPSFDQALAWTRDVAEGLDALHGHGLVHRDLKPANVMVEPSGRARLIDYGLLKPEEAGATLTAEGLLFGTPQYMAPELASGRATRASDLYALGCLVYELLAGSPPFPSGSPLEILGAHATRPFPPLPGGRGGPGLDRALARLLAKVAADRPASGSEAVGILERGLRNAAEPPDRVASTRVIERGAGPVPRTPPAVVLADPARGRGTRVVALVALTALAALWLHRPGRDDLVLAPDSGLPPRAGLLAGEPAFESLFSQGAGPWAATTLRLAAGTAKEASRLRDALRRARSGQGVDAFLRPCLEALGGDIKQLVRPSRLRRSLGRVPGGRAIELELFRVGFGLAAAMVAAATRSLDLESETNASVALVVCARLDDLDLFVDPTAPLGPELDRLAEVPGSPAELTEAMIRLAILRPAPGPELRATCRRILGLLKGYRADPRERGLAAAAGASLLDLSAEDPVRQVCLDLDPLLPRETRERVLRFALDEGSSLTLPSKFYSALRGAVRDLAPGEEDAEASARAVEARKILVVAEGRANGAAPGTRPPEPVEDLEPN